jgi:uncharacterized protein (TIRG00374 family)|tara:strand:+ start:3765 stop:4787 length:1023 start_codon:yes stop_codon:yes gene_type:complete
MRKSFFGAIGISVSVFLVWWVLKGENYQDIIEKISNANLWYLFFSVLVGTLGYLIRALRWKVLLEPMALETGLRSRFASVSMGFAANNLFPFRIGEIVRPVALSRVESVSTSGVVGSLVVERFLDSITVFSMLFLSTMMPSFPETEILWSGTGGSLMLSILRLLAGFCVVLICLVVFPQFFLNLGRKILLSRKNGSGILIMGALESFLGALSLLRDPKLFSRALLWSYSFWLWHALSFWLGFKAFGIEEGFVAAIFTMGIVGLAVAIPAGPGFFGTFQLGAMIALNGVFNVTEATTLAFAFGYHLGGFFPITFIGIYYAWKMGLSMKGLGRENFEQGDDL